MSINHLECVYTSFEQVNYSEAEAVALFLCKECVPSAADLGLPPETAAIVAAYLEKYADIFDVGKVRSLGFTEGGKLRQLLVVGCGSGRECSPNNFRKAAGEAVRHLHKLKITSAVIAAPILKNPGRAHYLQALAEGLYLGAYTFTECKGKQEIIPEMRLAVAAAIPNGEHILHKAAVIAAAVSYTRDLVNRPGNMVTPAVMAQEACATAAAAGMEVEVLGEDELLAKNMRAILAVGQGSVHKPKLITLKYNGNGNAPYIAYVGKGITFDSGGISIKPDDNMGEMKDDMAGAGAVLGAMKAIAGLRLPCNVIGILACAENMPGGNAQRPGDIVRAASGKTIEVVSTDAEGRMVLADAVWYACRQGAVKVIDIATLTGAVIIALGKETAGIVANDDELAEKIKTAGKLTGESYWQLPALPECKEALKSDCADLLNSAGRAGGCITGGLFIGEFIDEKVSWAHIDIGGTSTAEKTGGCLVKGGTGIGVRTLVNLAGLL